MNNTKRERRPTPSRRQAYPPYHTDESLAQYCWPNLGTTICFMYQCLMWKHVTVPGNNFEVASPISKVSVPKEVALKGGIELIIFGFGCHVLTSIPLKQQMLTLHERTFSSIFQKNRERNGENLR